MIEEEERTCNGSMEKTVESGIDSSLNQIKLYKQIIQNIVRPLGL